jgi:hypothetical protein
VDLKFKAQDMPVGKTAKPIELASRAVMVYRFDGMVFVSDAASTAYQYPMTDARLFKHPETGRVAAEVPLVSKSARIVPVTNITPMYAQAASC